MPRFISMPAGSTARWSSTPGTGSPWQSRAWRGLPLRLLEKAGRMGGMVKRFWQQAQPIALAIGFVLIVRTVVAEPYTVPTPSMVPTLLVGDQLVGAKYAYGYSKYSLPIGEVPGVEGRLFGRPPERGDVVVFRLPRDPSTTFVKRLIGLPGDRIQMREGRLYINDQLVPRRAAGTFEGDKLYVETLPASPGGIPREHEIVEISDDQRHDNTGIYVVPEGQYFMMGDNRD